jgi:hypothetical protein
MNHRPGTYQEKQYRNQSPNGHEIKKSAVSVKTPVRAFYPGHHCNCYAQRRLVLKGDEKKLPWYKLVEAFQSLFPGCEKKQKVRGKKGYECGILTDHFIDNCYCDPRNCPKGKIQTSKDMGCYDDFKKLEEL